jgi:hypothetical protein
MRMNKMRTNKMKMNKSLIKRISLTLFLTVSLVMANAQVGINTENPNPLTVLDVKSQVKPNGDIIPSGIMIPCMNESERNAIDVSNPAVANSLMVYNTDENCYNYFMGNEWRSLCGTQGKAVFTMDCASIKVNGDYIKGDEMTLSNYISLTVDVQKSGTYTFIATAATPNGYSFVASGIFTSAGRQTVNIPAQGTPTNNKTDNFTLVGSGSNCTFNVVVEQMVAEYSIDCASVTVGGKYLKGTALTTSNYIDVRVNISAAGYYEIKTPVTNGISFSKTGTFSAAGSQVVRLIASGKPTVNQNFNINIQANTKSGNTTCSTTIPLTLPPMTYAIIGNDIWSWNTSVRKAALANNSYSFSPNGQVKIENFTQLWATTSLSDARNWMTNGNGGKYPDIVLFFAYGSGLSLASQTDRNNFTAALAGYINRGGCVLYATIDNSSAATNDLLKAVFGSSYGTAKAQASAVTGGDDCTYLINNLASDPVVNGPFGNLGNKYWGEDNGTTASVVLTELPPNSVQICSAANTFGHTDVDPDYSIVWYNNGKNFFYFGDSTGATASSTSNSDYPTKYSSSGQPQSKQYGNYGMSNRVTPYVYNSALELNALAWLLKKAAVSGINPH